MIKLEGLSLKASDRLLQPLTLSLLFMVKRSRVMAIIGGNQFAKVNDRKSFDVQPRLVSAIFQRAPAAVASPRHMHERRSTHGRTGGWRGLNRGGGEGGEVQRVTRETREKKDEELRLEKRVEGGDRSTHSLHSKLPQSTAAAACAS